jgi:hypothetical protein
MALVIPEEAVYVVYNEYAIWIDTDWYWFGFSWEES